jgi:phage terminase large subunit-like protein
VVSELRAEPPEGLPDLSAFKKWKPDAQAKALRKLQEAQNEAWRPFFCPDPSCDGEPHAEWVWRHARVDQRPPLWTEDWLTLLFSGGRGSGKTRTGSEITHKVTAMTPRVILIAATGYDLRETMIEGRSGILATAKPGQKPEWEPSKKKLTWPNGTIGQCFSAEEPDRLRGPESGFIWADEPAHWDLVEECWSNMQFGLRVQGNVEPKIVATSTPLPTKWMKKLVKEDDTIVRRVSTYANLANLAPAFKKAILDKYEGTRLGRQELHGEILEDVEGALWAYDMFEHEKAPEEFSRIVVAVDPAGTANKRSDETGIIVIGLGYDLRLYVLEDLTAKYSPEGWATKANSAVEKWQADAIVVERNYGEDMVRFTLENAGYKGAHIIPVRSRRGKAIRAEPVVALYEKKKVVHCGDQTSLEDEQTTWVPGKGDSPNRVDALVHGATELAKSVMPSAIASPAEIFRNQTLYDE